MEIPNLSTQPETPVNTSKKSMTTVLISGMVVILALVSGFWLSRFFPSNPSSTKSQSLSSINNGEKIVVNEVKEGETVQVGKVYGNTSREFKDSATGTVQKGGINGEGTHTLVRNGVNQNAALTSSSVDLDLFVGKKVEVKGETNSSKKTGWLLDVATIKILE